MCVGVYVCGCVYVSMYFGDGASSVTNSTKINNVPHNQQLINMLNGLPFHAEMKIAF